MRRVVQPGYESRHTRMLPILGCVAALASGGCSLVFVSRPPSDVQAIPVTKQIDCTTSRAAPILDTVLGGLEAVRTGVALAAKDSDYAKLPISKGADIGFGVAFTALFAASAIYGYNSTAQCSDEKERRELALEERPFVPATPLTPLTPAFSSAPAPTEVAGFSFGSSMAAARAVCEGASFEWREGSRASQCSGTPVNNGLDGRARITSCGDEICRIEILIVPKTDEGSPWLDRFTQILADLRDRYGEPTSHDVEYADASCTNVRLLECLQSGQARFHYEWRWKDRRRIILSLGSRIPRPSASDAKGVDLTTIHVRYEDGRQPERVPKPPVTSEDGQPATSESRQGGPP